MEKSNGRRVIMFPLPLQGCINPMIQLAKILHSRGFSITVIHTRFNAPKATSHPLFTFLEIQDGLSETETRTDDNTWLFTLLNRRCETPFRDCLTNLLGSSSDSETERISCLIHDSGWTFFTRSVAKSLKLPRLVLNTYTVSFFLNHFALPKLRREVSLLSQDSEQDDLVQDFPPLRKKDLLRILKEKREYLEPYLNMILETTKSSSGIIFMSCEELEQDSLCKAREDFNHQAIGGFLTHNGWNSTVESVREGVPMICLPCIWDQFVDARLVSDVWRVGLHLEHRIERNEIESSIRSLFYGDEGESIRERMRLLQEKVGRSVKENDIRTDDNTWLFTLLNRRCEAPFRDCLTKLLGSSDSETERISCLIHDSGWTFTGSVAESLKLPRLVLNVYTVSYFRSHFALPKLRREVNLLSQDQDDVVQEFQPLRKKDLVRLLKEKREYLEPYLNMILGSTKSSSGIIFVMSCEELDQDSLPKAREDFKVPIFAIGPSHSKFPASSSSLFTQDETCIPWLDKQEDRSVIYVSFGSLASMTGPELIEIACGLRNSGQPFLLVVRVGSVKGTEWIEAIPEELMAKVNEKGKIVKWAPQQEVLKHRAIGGFLTHNGMNSVVESICEGVPMICLPCLWDQFLYARLVSDVWRVGLHLEHRIERNEIESAIRRLLFGSEGEAIRERMTLLKEKVERSVEENGSAYRSLESLIDHISSF
ncbi:unnamed protein product [Brassica rapa]|uniref:UDP-glycosyltransferases domain-containing protein n=1 Tax=Brassica campestris TaxID=3711 RepID=A0A8D9MJL1_BRACM|nr:unnamed protein product [Brassica rapa]